MARLGPHDLLFPRRADLPRVKDMTAAGSGGRIESLLTRPSAADGGGGGGGEGAADGFKWRLVARGSDCSAAGIAHNQTLQHLCLKQILSTFLAPKPRECRLGFESDFCGILAGLVAGPGNGKGRDGQEEQTAKTKRRASPAAFLEYQRMLRSTIFFSPYLKFVFQMNVINRTLSEQTVSALNPHFFSTLSQTGQGVVRTPGDGGASLAFYANAHKDTFRDCLVIKLTFLGLPSAGLVTAVVGFVVQEFSNDNFVHDDHGLLSCKSYLECFPRRVDANRDLVEFSASFPRGNALQFDWQDYVHRCVRWCEVLLRDCRLLCETPGDAASLRPRVDVRRPADETRTHGARNLRDMMHFKTVNYQDSMMDNAAEGHVMY